MNIYIHFLYFHSIYTYLICSLNIYISLFKLHFKKQFSRISFPISVLIFYLKLFKISPLFSQMHFEDFEHNGSLLEKIGTFEEYESEKKNFPYFHHLEMMTVFQCVPFQYFLMSSSQTPNNIDENFGFYFYFVFYCNETSSSFHHEVPCLLKPSEKHNLQSVFKKYHYAVILQGL